MQKAISKYWPVFVLPTLIAFIIGFIWPFIWGVYLSFQRFTTVSKTTFVGIQNYISVFQDSTFLHAFGFTAASCWATSGRSCSTACWPTCRSPCWHWMPRPVLSVWSS